MASFKQDMAQMCQATTLTKIEWRVIYRKHKSRLNMKPLGIAYTNIQIKATKEWHVIATRVSEHVTKQKQRHMICQEHKSSIEVKIE